MTSKKNPQADLNNKSSFYFAIGLFLVLFILIFSVILKVKSGLSTVNNMSGLKFSISFTVSFIFFLILKRFKITLVKPKYVISLRS